MEEFARGRKVTRMLTVALLLLAGVGGASGVWVRSLENEFRRGLVEDTPPGTVLGTLVFQSPNGNIVTYSTDAFYLNVNAQNGIVTLASELSYRRMHNTRISFSAKDGSNPASLRTIQVRILPVNHPPTFDSPSYRFSVKDNVAVGTEVYNSINVIDRDQGNNGSVNVECVSSTCEYFTVVASAVAGFSDRRSVSIRVRRALNQNINPKYLQLRASDKGNPPLSSIVNVSFIIENSQDSRPVFSAGPYIIRLLENSFEANKDVLVMQVTDARPANDANDLLVTILEDINFFTIGPITGPSNDGVYSIPIRQQRALSLEENKFNSRYTFVVKASQRLNGQDLNVFSQALVTVNIDDVNNNVPTFDRKQYTASVSEGLTNGATVPGLQMVISDRDTGLNGRYSLTLEAPPSLSGVFDVTPKAGQGDTAVALVVNNPSAIRYSSDPNQRTYRLTVRATETDTQERRSSSASISLQVSPPTNNRPPSFPNNYNPFSVADNTPVDSIISNFIQAVDEDTGDNGRLTYSISDNDNSQTYFKINPTTGVLRLKSRLSASVTPTFSFDAIATDGGGLSALAAIKVDVVNTNGPIFTPSFYSANVTELTTTLIPQIRVLAKMGPLKSDRVISYKLVQQTDFNVTSFFSINPSTGDLQLISPVDFNHTPAKDGLLEFEVEASVVNNNNIPTNRATIRIFVLDTNNNPPRFLPTSTYYKTINETTPPNTYVTQVRTSDNDTGINAQVSYLLLDGAINEFTVDRLGVVRTAPSALLRPERTYEIKVLAIDAGQPPLSSTARVLINVTDVIKDPPSYDTEQFVFYIREDSNTGRLIGSVKAKNNEAKGIIRYTFVQDSWKAYDVNNNPAPNVPVWTWFSLDENTAQLRVQNRLSHSLAAKATVNVSAQITNMQVESTRNTAYVLVTINISPVDLQQDRVVFTPSRTSYVIDVLERLPIQTQVFRFSAFEIRSNSPVRDFRLTPRMPSQADTFIVEKETGIMKVIKDVVYVDLKEKNFTYVLEALASPPSSASASADVIVRVLPLSPDPVFDMDEYNFDIRNRAPRLTYVGRVKAVSPFPQQAPPRYSLASPSDLFQIDPNNGNITLQRALTTQQLLYNLFARAQSSNTTHTFSSNVLVNIRVLVAKTLMPRFEASMYRFLVPLSSQGAVGRVVAFDPNPYNPSRIIYSIYNSTQSGYFSINPDSGIIQATRPLDKNATLIVVATAADNSSFNNHTSVHVQTFLPSSQTPSFLFPNSSRAVVLGSASSTFQLQVQGQASRPGGVVRYSLDPSTPQQALRLFSIDSNTGLLRFRPNAIVPPGFNSYQLVLKLSDEYSTKFKRFNVDVFGNSSPSFACYASSFVLTAGVTPGRLTPPLNISSPSACSNNLPDTIYYYKITKINDIDYDDSPYRDWFILDRASPSAVFVNATTHLFFRDNLKYKLAFAVANSQADLQRASQRTSSHLETLVRIDPFFSPGPSFLSTNPLCPGSGLEVFAGILDLTPANTPVFKMVAGDCDGDPARPNTYEIASSSYVPPTHLLYGEEAFEGEAFVINPLTGLVLTKLRDYSLYYRGRFEVVVVVNSPFKKSAQALLKVYILREMQKRKVTFDKPFVLASAQRDNFTRDINKELQRKNITLVADHVSTLVNNDATRNLSRSSMCYFTVGLDGRVSVEGEEVMREAVRKISNSYRVADVAQECLKRVASTEDWSGRTTLWWVLIAFSIVVFFVALILAFCVCFFWPINVRKMAESRPYIVLDDPHMSTAGSVFDYK